MNSSHPSKQTEMLIKAGILTGLCVSLYLIYYHILPALGAIVSFIAPVLLPFILALIIAILVDPIVTFITERSKIPRGLSVITVLIFSMVIIGVFLVFLTSRLLSELYKLSKNIPDWYGFTDQLINRVQVFYTNVDISPEILQQIQEAASNIGTALTKAITVLINQLIGFLTSLPGIMMILLITIIATFFMSKDQEKIQKFFINSLPEKWRSKVRSVYMDLTKALVGYFRAQVTLITITTIISISGLYIIGVDYALTMGLVTGIFDILPVLGPGTVYVPWILWMVAAGNFKLAASLTALYVIIVVMRQIMEPKLVAENIGVHPLATLASIFIGLKILGVVGIFLGPVILVTGKAIKKAKTM